MKKFKYAYQVGGLWGDVRTRIPRIAKLGYDAVEVAGVTSYFHEGKEFKKICDSEGIAVSSVCTNCAELDMAYPRKEVSDQGIDYMCRVVDFAADLGGNGVIINPTRLTKWTPLAELEQELAWGAESIQKVADYAAGAGIKLFVEVWNRYDTYLLNRAEQGRAFVKMVNKPNVGVMLDTFHMNIEEKDIAAAVREAGDMLMHFHVGDSNRAAPGMGHIDFLPILQAIKDINYKGFVTMELFPPAFHTDSYVKHHDTSYLYLKYPEFSIQYLKKIEEKLQ